MSEPTAIRRVYCAPSTTSSASFARLREIQYRLVLVDSASQQSAAPTEIKPSEADLGIGRTE
ncbi:hypothetical protein J116_013420 [Streptomyces thermolilacinus SPC6]|uniref:Uncharacterized protein n=1 Tax=Streptomyces thermolilacinus SPC6 TaxID=1306406 RepID=A0A1D3DSN8_9ACTN|nr:hypothetical protein J116_013420 [Streptomyces thermolilacinus SPC6]